MTSRRGFLIAAPVPLLMTAVMLSGCTGSPTSAFTTSTGLSPSQGAVSATPSEQGTSLGIVRIAEADRRAAPPLSGPAIGPGDGGSLTVTDFAGSVIVVNAWASWCPPCREEIPEIILTAGLTRSLGVVVLGLNVSDDTAAATSFIEASGMNYPSIVDAQGVLLTTIPGVPPQALPSTIVIDRAGRIAARIIGPVTAGDLEQVIRAVAQEATT